MVGQKYFLRDIIGGYLEELGSKEDKVVLVNADLMGTCRNRGFAEAYPERTFNVGIAEQNLVSFSAGLAHEGFIPYAFTMAPFMSMRACEAVRTDVAYANLRVRFMATYAGLSGGISGATHWSIEDCGIMTSIPNITVLEPSDPIQAKHMMDASLDYFGPIYMRSSVEPVERLYSEDYDYQIGKADILHKGDDGVFIVSGVVVQYALNAAIELEKSGLNIQVIDMHTIKPIDREAVIKAANTGTVIVAQDHNVYGGLGSMVAQVIAEEQICTKFKVLGIPDKFVAMAHAPFLYREFEYDAQGLMENMMKLIK